MLTFRSIRFFDLPRGSAPLDAENRVEILSVCGTTILHSLPIMGEVGGDPGLIVVGAQEP